MREFVEYKGEKFWLQSTGRYFQSGRRTNVERLLHRRIWIEHNGEIPEGYAVHHIDGNWRNNDISNLQMMTTVDHMRQHMLERWESPEFVAKMKVALAKAQEAAKAWHASPEGHKWHSQMGKTSWQGRQRVKANVSCQHCGSDIETFFPTRTRFCSRRCSRNANYPARFTLQKDCGHCGSAFVTSRYKPSTFCSKTCSVHNRNNIPAFSRLQNATL